VWQLPVSVVLAAVAIVAGGLGAATVPLLYLAVMTPELIRVDVTQRRLPNGLVVPGILIAAGSVAVEGIVGRAIPLAPLVAGAGYAGFMLLLAAFGGMGMGDVKLAACLGLSSWVAAVGVGSPVIAFLSGGVASIVLLVRRGRGGTMAFGPFLLAGFWVAVAAVAVVRF
jgi:leader peptidase (prepilin peptidase)/N-methyltransferase